MENALRAMVIPDYDPLKAIPDSILNKLDRCIPALSRLKSRGGQEDLTLPDFVATTGAIVLQSYKPNGSEANAKIICGKRSNGQGIICQGGNYYMSNLDVDYAPVYTNSAAAGLLYGIFVNASGARLNIRSGTYRLVDTSGVTGAPSLLYYSLFKAGSGGSLTLNASGDNEPQLSIVFDPQKTRGDKAGYVLECEEGTIGLGGSNTSQVAATFKASGDWTRFVQNSGGKVIRAGSTTYKAAFDTTGQTAVGSRYAAINGGTINVGGAGPDYFPGNEAGFVQSSTYSWYQ